MKYPADEATQLTNPALAREAVHPFWRRILADPASYVIWDPIQV